MNIFKNSRNLLISLVLSFLILLFASDFVSSNEMLLSKYLKTNSPSELAVSCSLSDLAWHEKKLHIRIENKTQKDLYIFSSDRMPYSLINNGTIIILYGIHPTPNPHKAYGGIESPETQPIRAGQSIENDINIVPFVVQDHFHFGYQNTVNIYGEMPLQCLVGWGNFPIERFPGFNRLLEWQNISASEVIDVDFGNRFLNW